MNIIFEKLSSNLFFGLILNYCIGHIFYNGKRHIKLVVAIFIVVFSFITELMTAALFGVVFNASIQGVRDNVMHLFLGGIVSKILLMLLVEIIIRFRKRNASKVSVGSWLLIVSIPICSIVLAVTSVYKPIVNNTHSDVAVIACLAIVYINVITFYLFDNIISQINENNQFRSREEQLLLQKTQYENIISGYNQVKKIRHDMLGHLVVIKGYLSNEKIHEAKNYIGNIHQELDFSKRGILSSNVAVDAIINNKISLAKQSGIEVTHDIIIPQHMMIDDMDICIVLGNALNNAIEACQRVENPMNKKIELKMRYKRKTLTVEMKNPYDINTVNLKNGKYVSSKKFRKDYEIGIGMESIKAVAKKYNGLCETDMQSEIFVLKVIMPNEKLI